MNLDALLAAHGAKLRARQEAAKAELEAESEEIRRQETDWRARRDAEWADESKRLAEPADVLTWPQRRRADG